MDRGYAGADFKTDLVKRMIRCYFTNILSRSGIDFTSKPYNKCQIQENDCEGERMYTRLWKLITGHIEEASRMAVFLTTAVLIWTVGITVAGILVCMIKHMEVICRLSDLVCAGIYAGLVFGLFGGGCFLWNHRDHLYQQK